ncbi:hypothetical protein DUNSADRAFT_8423 [Dunaliella salina]|uniref:Encoded protein n=1 Tax=Dunaliella salina TaxID=3046 RepID=A0ABQ7GJK3_DUNSA|nr:hypothetical protein DUNSADRAFT_8423 [Dunaliella salina]|eukprot:KAF5834782.1 hypothetical protein DUNSADRAFT_8423 [Dunaliella salina]
MLAGTNRLHLPLQRLLLPLKCITSGFPAVLSWRRGLHMVAWQAGVLKLSCRSVCLMCCCVWEGLHSALNELI